jgi:serine/threonine-protein kinase RsbW
MMDAIEMTLLAVPAAAATARREVTRRLSARVAVNALEDVRLLLTELVTNALRHGKVTAEDEIGVRAEVAEGTVRIEVHDPGRNGEVEPRRPGARGGGYGLFLVDRLTSRWGVDHRDGTTVWAELPAGAAR